ncbi:MAG TPA: metal-dependent hydrolase [Puia sp.]|nr:metal-dependent hydrolase [Puia sp.]
MDSITHIVLGATIGDALAGRRLGKKAMVLGAVAQSLPDIDFIASFWLDTSHDVAAHRGITHSFLFVGVMALLLAFAAGRIYRGAAPNYGGEGMSRMKWLLFFGLQLFVHIFLDAFNAYGTGWFEPFSHYRVSFNVLFVADPFYSVWLGISFLALLILRRSDRRRKFWAAFGLIFSSLYLCYCISNKLTIEHRLQKELQRRPFAVSRHFTTPTPLNSWLWYLVAEDSLGYHTGYLSVFDRQPVTWQFFPRNDALLTPFRIQEDVRELLRFSQNYYTVEKWNDTLLVFNDLRFGQMKGWEDGRAHFVFHYFLERPGDNAVIVQRGRFHGWNGKTFLEFVKRIRGN